MPEPVRKKYRDRIEWHNAEGLPHRLDGPAVEWKGGSKEWYKDGVRHRLDGPAAEWADGTRIWFKNGEIHRLDGPAIEKADGTKSWYNMGVQVKPDAAELYRLIMSHKR